MYIIALTVCKQDVQNIYKTSMAYFIILTVYTKCLQATTSVVLAPTR